MGGRKKVKYEKSESDMSSVSGESSLENLSVLSSDLKGLT